jgi:putative ABC transport system permease protein
MLGIVIGVGAVIAMASIGAGAEAQIESQIASLGSNVLVVQPGSQNVAGVRGGNGGSQTLTLDDAAAISQQVPSVAAAAPMVRGGSQVVVGNHNWYSRVTGTTAEYFPIHDLTLNKGLSFTSFDVSAIGKVAVIGPTVEAALFEPGSNPIGQLMRLNQVPFTIIGVLNPKGQSPTGQDQDDVILVPITTALKRVMGRTGNRANLVSNIDVQARSSDLVPLAERQVGDLLRYRHEIAAGEEDDFQVRMMAERYEARQEASAVMSLLLASIAGVSLLVGGIGIMNIMLVSVTERTREIGIRMAVGARSKAVQSQSLIESVVLGLAGGLAGIALGIGISFLLSAGFGWPQLISPAAVVGSAVFSMAIGVFFGYYPARKAANLDPIEALRFE